MEAPDCPAATSKRVIDLRDGTIKTGVSEFLRAKETTEEASLVLRTLPLDGDQAADRCVGKIKSGHALSQSETAT